MIRVLASLAILGWMVTVRHANAQDLPVTVREGVFLDPYGVRGVDALVITPEPFLHQAQLVHYRVSMDVMNRLFDLVVEVARRVEPRPLEEIDAELRTCLMAILDLKRSEPEEIIEDPEDPEGEVWALVRKRCKAIRNLAVEHIFGVQPLPTAIFDPELRETCRKLSEAIRILWGRTVWESWIFEGARNGEPGLYREQGLLPRVGDAVHPDFAFMVPGWMKTAAWKKRGFWTSRSRTAEGLRSMARLHQPGASARVSLRHELWRAIQQLLEEDRQLLQGATRDDEREWMAFLQDPVWRAQRLASAANLVAFMRYVDQHIIVEAYTAGAIFRETPVVLVLTPAMMERLRAIRGTIQRAQAQLGKDIDFGESWRFDAGMDFLETLWNRASENGPRVVTLTNAEADQELLRRLVGWSCASRTGRPTIEVTLADPDAQIAKTFPLDSWMLTRLRIAEEHHELRLKLRIDGRDLIGRAAMLRCEAWTPEGTWVDLGELWGRPASVGDEKK
ncbi:MAG: hypothetical protein H6834_09945 [Planctomycetes bacterium]|nr:hypothetical protein [Planctomycetota bacterium]